MAVTYYDDNIIKMIDNWSRPLSTMMIVGPTGSGKHGICEYISEKFHLDIKDITDRLTLETIEEINQSVFPALYIIDTEKITVKEQNTILKFLEEPFANAFIVLLCNNLNYLLDTIKNRCLIYQVKPFTKDELSSYSNGIDTDIKLKLAETPGQMITLNSINVQSLYDFAFKVIDKIQVANIVNALISITDKIAFKDEQDKFNLMLFCKALLVVCTDKIMNDKNFNSRYYELTNKLYNDLQIPNIKTVSLFENYIISMKG